MPLPQISTEDICFNRISMFAVNAALFQDLGFISRMDLVMLDAKYSVYEKRAPTVVITFNDLEQQMNLIERIIDLEKHECLKEFDIMAGCDIVENLAEPVELKKIQKNHRTAAGHHLTSADNCRNMVEMYLTVPAFAGELSPEIPLSEQIARMACVCHLLTADLSGASSGHHLSVLRQSFLETLDGLPETILKQQKKKALACVREALIDDLPEQSDEYPSEFDELIAEQKAKHDFAVRKNNLALIKKIENCFDKKKKTLPPKELTVRAAQLMALTDMAVLYSPKLSVEDKKMFSNLLDMFRVYGDDDTEFFPMLQAENKNLLYRLKNNNRERE